MPLVVWLGIASPTQMFSQQVAEVQVAPVTVTMSVGERRELMADAYDSRGDIVTTASFSWTSSDPNVVRVEEDPSLPGIATLIGLNEGIAAIEARVGNRHASAAVQVVGVTSVGQGAVGGGVATVLQIEPASIFLLPSEEIRPQPRFLNDNGDLASPALVSWRFLGQPGVAEVRDRGGILGLSPGQGVLEAVTQTGLLARVTVQVAQAEFTFRSTEIGLSPNLSDSIEVTVPDQNNRPLAPNWLVWRSTNPGVVHVSPLGVVTGRSPGQAQIIATGFGQESRVTVAVHRPVVSLLAMPPYSEPVSVPLGGFRNFTATPEAVDETPIPEAPLTWHLADTAIASFNESTGTLTGKVIGQTRLTVKAPGEGLEVVWDVNVVAGGLNVEPDKLPMSRGDRFQLSASFTDEDGRAVSKATSLTWTSSDPAVAGVDADGNLEPRGIGSARIVANTPWGTTDSVTVYVVGEILVTSTRGGNVDIYSFDRDRPDTLHQLTDLPGSETSAVFSPDGTKIAFISDQGGNLDIFVVDADGTNPVQLTSTHALEGSPAWTPDGSRIFYESDESGSSQIWSMNADGSDPVQITQGDQPCYRPSVSPDGQRVLFASSNDDTYDIYMMNVDGANQVNLTESQWNETFPVWINDTSVAFIQESGRGRNRSRSIVKMELNESRDLFGLFSQSMMVTNFAISSEGDMIAASVSAQGPQGVEHRLYLIPTAPDGVPVEVQRFDTADQLVSPSFRRR
jgi:TolB protein